MALELTHLDDSTRKHMLSEIQKDVAEKTLYISPRLTESCAEEYADLLMQAAANGRDEDLANELVKSGRLKSLEPRKGKNGITMVKVPVTAHETLSEGEFNRFYMRGLCIRAQEEGLTRLVIYRAKAVTNPRADSEIMIGSEIEVSKLLEDLRTNIGTDTALGLPPGPNSGLSVRLPSNSNE